MEFITNWGHVWPCGADITGIFEYAYMIFYYASNFVENQNSVNIAYVIMYSAYMVDLIVTIRCSIKPTYASSYSIEDIF